MKMYNTVGCTIEGLTLNESEQLKKAGWVDEDTYKKLHPEEFE